jgi:hypothetical protein
VDSNSANLLEQHTTDKHITPLEHIITTSLYSLSFIYRWTCSWKSLPRLASLSLSLSLSKFLEQFRQCGIFHILLISHSPFCNIIVCSDPPTVPHAVFSLELAETDIFQYNCSAGFNLIGDNAIQCQPDATWTNIMFTCTSKYQCTPTNNYLYWDNMPYNFLLQLKHNSSTLHAIFWQ